MLVEHGALAERKLDPDLQITYAKLLDRVVRLGLPLLEGMHRGSSPRLHNYAGDSLFSADNEGAGKHAG